MTIAESPPTLESVLESALEPSGAAAPFAPDGFVKPLERLVTAIDAEAGLTAHGRRTAAAALNAALATQRAVTRFDAEQPGAPLPPVAFITGLHRTGTTLLQGLLSEHPDIRAPRLWELRHPIGGRRPEHVKPLIDETTAYVEAYYRAAPEFRDIHPLDALQPEECHRLIGVSFLSEIYALRYRVPGYLAWLDEQDHRPAYAVHRLALRALLSRGPAAGTVVLKCPFHLWHAADLAATYPTARVIRLHRDPVATIASICSLTKVVRSAYAENVSAAEIGDQWLQRTRIALDRAVSTTDAGFGGLPVLDLAYPDLARDPLAAAARVCEFLGVPMTDEARERMRRRLDDAGASHTRHTYSAEDFGLSTPALTRSFSDYRAEFGL